MSLRMGRRVRTESGGVSGKLDRRRNWKQKSRIDLWPIWKIVFVNSQMCSLWAILVNSQKVVLVYKQLGKTLCIVGINIVAKLEKLVVSITKKEEESESDDWVTLQPSARRRRSRGRCLRVSYCTSSPHSDSVLGVCGPPWFSPIRGFHVKYLSLCFLFSVCIFVILDLLHPHTYTSQPVVAGYDPNMLCT
mgnify:CR=1 FL=1